MAAAPDIAAAKRGGLDVDFERLSAEGDGFLTAEDRYALKTYGVCAQAQDGVFMIRIRVPGGRLSPDQADGLAKLADDYGGSWIHLSTRQNAELHGVGARDVAAVLSAVETMGLTNRSACGHTMRNVMACPDAGVGLDEPFDCYPDARLVSDAILARSAELNCVLPSRVNIAFGGCPRCAEHARLNDIGFESRVVDGRAGYRLWAAGSLGTTPALAIKMRDFVSRQNALAAAEALIDVFVSHGDLDHPKKARMKFIVERLGEDRFRVAFEEAFGDAMARPHVAVTPIDVAGSAQLDELLAHVPEGGWSSGVRPQRTPGLAMVTVNVPLGDLDATDVRQLAAIARDIGDGWLYLTRNQNVQYRDVSIDDVASLRDRLADLGLDVAGADTATDVRACTGSAVCSLAITAAPTLGARLIKSPALTRNATLRVHVSGCPNSCAQHQAADIGLSGAKVRVRGETKFGYHLWVGAAVAEGKAGRLLGRFAEADVEAGVEAVVATWEALRHPTESLADTIERLGTDGFATYVSALSAGFEAGDDDSAVAGEPAKPRPVVRRFALTRPAVTT